jgi:carbon starvation protein
VLSSDPSIGFVSHAWKFGDALAAGKILAPAKSIEEMQRIVMNDAVDATLAAIFVALVVAVLVFGLIEIRRALANPQVTAVEADLTGTAMGGVRA